MAQLYIINYYKYIKYVCIYIYMYTIYIYIIYIKLYIMYTQGNIYIHNDLLSPLLLATPTF